MDVRTVSTKTIRPYEKNPRRNDDAVEAVAASIREFGFQQPIVVDVEGVIIAGHTRYKAAKRLGLASVPIVVAENLTPEQVKAYRLADNRVGELAEWDEAALFEELAGIDLDMGEFGFLDELAGDIDAALENARENGVRDEAYEEFEAKFEPKLTTDDCYTPPLVYEAAKAWALKEYGWEGRRVVRPFYPGGDYTRENYSGGAVVIDNPPFSILSEIVRFYEEHGVDYFLFAPHLTLFGARAATSRVCTGTAVIYDNGANVNTSFLASQGATIRSAPALHEAVKEAVRQTRAEQVPELPKYEYPVGVMTSVRIGYMSHNGVEYQENNCERVSELESQKEYGKAIFGGGFLVPREKAAQAEAARIAAQEAREKENLVGHAWELSPREIATIEALERRAQHGKA